MPAATPSFSAVSTTTSPTRRRCKRASEKHSVTTPRLLVVDFDTRRQWNRPSGVPESRDGHGIAKTLLVAEMEDAGFELVSDLKWHNGDYSLVFRAR